MKKVKISIIILSAAAVLLATGAMLYQYQFISEEAGPGVSEVIHKNNAVEHSFVEDVKDLLNAMMHDHGGVAEEALMQAAENGMHIADERFAESLRNHWSQMKRFQEDIEIEVYQTDLDKGGQVTTVSLVHEHTVISLIFDENNDLYMFMLEAQCGEAECCPL